MVAQTPLGVDLYHGDVLPSSHLRGRPAAFPAGMRSGRAWLAHKITEGASFRDPAALGRLPVAGQAGMLLAVYQAGVPWRQIWSYGPPSAVI